MKYINSYMRISSSLKTGDILFFSGNSFFSKMIKLCTRSHWSHVGMVYVNENSQTFCWESDKESASSNLSQLGVRFIPIEEKIESYSGEVAVKRLEGLAQGDLLKLHDAITKVSFEFKNRPYEKSSIELFQAAYDGPFGDNVEDVSSLFCSELIATVYQLAGLLPLCPPGLPSNEYTPADFDRITFKLLKGGLSEIFPIKSKAEEIIISEVEPKSLISTV